MGDDNVNDNYNDFNTGPDIDLELVHKVLLGLGFYTYTSTARTQGPNVYVNGNYGMANVLVGAYREYRDPDITNVNIYSWDGHMALGIGIRRDQWFSRSMPISLWKELS